MLFVSKESLLGKALAGARQTSEISMIWPANKRLLFGVNEKLLTQHVLGPVTKYKLLYVSNQGVRVRAMG